MRDQRREGHPGAGEDAATSRTDTPARAPATAPQAERRSRRALLSAATLTAAGVAVAAVPSVASARTVVVQGMTGATGPAGPVGPAGVTGPRGATGATGATGVIGAVGATGATGASGVAGPTGVQGVPGSDGAPGDTVTGPTGVTGATGATGAAGSGGAAMVQPTEVLIELRAPIATSGNVIHRASTKGVGYVGVANTHQVTFLAGSLGEFDAGDTPTMTFHIETIATPTVTVVPDPIAVSGTIAPDGSGTLSFEQLIPAGLTSLKYVFTPMFAYPV